MEKKYYVYVYLDTRKTGNFTYGEYTFCYQPFYVGKGRYYRHKRHLNDSQLSDNSHKSNLIKKLIQIGLYPDILIVNSGLTQTQAFELEKKLILNIGRYDLKTGPLTNKTEGGEGISGYKWTEEQKIKNKNRKPSKLGYITSNETKIKIGLGNKGKIWKNDIERIEKYKKLKSSQTIGERNPFFGHNHSNDFLKKIRKEIIMYNQNMEELCVYESLTECSKKTGFPISKISSVANNKIKHYKGYKFKYK